jgi:transcriptional regulator CtsR
MEAKYITSILQGLEAETGCPFNTPKVKQTVYNLFIKWAKIPNDMLFSIMLDNVEKMVELYKGRTDNNLAIVMVYVTRYAALNYLQGERAQKRGHGTSITSLDAEVGDDGDSVSSLVGSVDLAFRAAEWKDIFDKIIASNVLTEREAEILHYMLDEEMSCRKIGAIFNVSGAAINLSQKAIYKKLSRPSLRKLWTLAV